MQLNFVLIQVTVQADEPSGKVYVKLFKTFFVCFPQITIAAV